MVFVCVIMSSVGQGMIRVYICWLPLVYTMALVATRIHYGAFESEFESGLCPWL